MSLTIPRLSRGATNKHRGTLTSPSEWWDTAYEQRLRIRATNTSGVDLHDHLITYTLPVTVDAGSLRVVEHSSLGTIDRGCDTRYGNNGSVNRIRSYPASLSGSVLTFKALGRWVAGTTRTFGLYWSLVNGQTQPSFSHLDCVAQGWTATALAGTAGDTYALVVGGTTYSYTMIGGDTATIIATALKNLINAGVVATATSAAGVVTVKTATPRIPSFTVTNTGTTTPANLVIVKPGGFTIGRLGPDTELTPSTGTGWYLGLPFGQVATQGAFRASLTQSTVSTGEVVRLLSYQVSGDGATYGIADGVVNTVSIDGPTVTATGTLTGSTRAGGVDWTGTYTSVYENKIAALTKTDGTNANNVTKQIGLAHLTMTLTCARAHTPPADTSGNGTVSTNYSVFNLATSSNSYSGNTTILAGSALPKWYAAPGGATTAWSANTDVSALSLAGGILGLSGSGMAMALKINSAAVSGFGASHPNVGIKWFGSILQVYGLTANSIPVNAQITLDLVYAFHDTNSPSTAGDVVTPQEMTAILQNATVAPAFGVVARESFNASSLAATMQNASDRARDGIAWFQQQTSLVGLAGNSAFQYDVLNATVSQPDDDDGNYGEAFKLAGLCLRYLRTRDATLIPLIETQVNFHLAIEAAAVSAYGTAWNGSSPYWYWNSSTPSGAFFTAEGQLGTTDIDPSCNKLTGITVTAGGTGYTTPPTVTISSPLSGGTVATGTATISGGAVTAIALNVAGSQYPASPLPTVTITGGGGSGATATAAIVPSLGALNYVQGQVRRDTSIDQMHMVTHGLYCYLYLLRNESAITANATVQANAFSLLSRMRTFEAAHCPADSCVIANVYALCTGGSPAYGNGITATKLNAITGATLPNPYNGDLYDPWQDSNTDGAIINPSSNSAFDFCCRSVYSSNGDNAGTLRFLQGRCMDMLTADLSRHTVVKGGSATNWGVLDTYPAGWSVRAGPTGNLTKYNAALTPDKHYILANDGGARDAMSGRAAQRAIILGLAAWFDPTYSVPVETNGSGVVTRSVNVSTAFDDVVRALALYGSEPTTSAQRFAAAGYLGNASSSNAHIIDSAYTGYWMMAVELWFLVQQRKAGVNQLPTLYKFAGV